jgi:MYXO-CTERM domain-containing protein
MASEGLLTLADVPALAGRSSEPIVVGWTCNLVRFDIPGFSSLGEQLVTQGASAGVFSATGWSNHFETDFLRTTFTEAVFASEAETIGEAMIRAHRAATDASVAQHRVFMLLGDPALRLRPAPREPEPEPSAEPDPSIVSPPSSGPDLSSLPPRTEAALPASTAGCEIARSDRDEGPAGPGLLILGAVLLIRQRRSSRSLIST